MKLSSLLYPGEYTSASSAEEIEINGIVSNTDGLRKGALFICLRGTRFDSHTLLSKVEEAGAAAVIVERDAPIPSCLTIPIFTETYSCESISLQESQSFGPIHLEP